MATIFLDILPEELCRIQVQNTTPFEYGVASHDTFGRVFALLDAAVFEQCFGRWMRSVFQAFNGLQAALDGKAVRRSKSFGHKVIHLVSAFAHGLGLPWGR